MIEGVTVEIVLVANRPSSVALISKSRVTISGGSWISSVTASSVTEIFRLDGWKVTTLDWKVMSAETNRRSDS